MTSLTYKQALLGRLHRQPPAAFFFSGGGDGRQWRLVKALSQITSNAAIIDSTLPPHSPGRGETPLPAHLVGAETLLGVVGELVADVDQVVVGVDVVQAVGLSLAGGLAHVLAVAEQAVEVELVGVLAVGGQAGVAAGEWRKKKGIRNTGQT